MVGPAVRPLLEQDGITATDVTASGPQGLLLKGDVLNHIKAANLLPKTCKNVGDIFYILIMIATVLLEFQ